MIDQKKLSLVIEKMKIIPKIWDAKNAIIEMKNSNYCQWKQMEWIGFYFEFLCKNYLLGVMEFNKINYKNTFFDGYLDVPFDFKSHVKNSGNSKVIINDTESIIFAINTYGSLIIIIAIGDATFDDNSRSFQLWHEKLKGGKSKYELERIQRGAKSRLRKTKFIIDELLFVKIDKFTLKRCDSFQKNFRNADGSSRKPKILLDLNSLNKSEIIESIKFL